MFACLRATYMSCTIDFFSSDSLSTDKVGNIISLCLLVVAGLLSLTTHWVELELQTGARLHPSEQKGTFMVKRVTVQLLLPLLHRRVSRVFLTVLSHAER